MSAAPAPDPAAPAVRLRDVVRRFGAGEAGVAAVNGVSLDLACGAFVAITGRSGSGKSTLLNLIAGIDTPTSGEVWVEGRALGGLSDDARTRLRRDRIGMVYQFFHLLPTLSVRENVALPGVLAGGAEHMWLARADRLLDEVGLAQRREARPHTLSGGELQRAALARALVHEPALVLADEPTGNLDTRAAAHVLDLLAGLVRRRGATLVLVTHSPEAAARAARTIELSDGRVVRDAAAGAAGDASTTGRG